MSATLADTKPDVGTPLRGPQLRTLQRDLVSARDEQIMRVVAMVDQMTKRGEADALIAPLRARLAQLRPQRPLTFARLLFIPFDPLIVVAPQWRRGIPGIPRTAIAPIGAAVYRALGAEAAAIERTITGATTGRAEVVMSAGSALWPMAGPALAGARAPDDWTEATGLPSADFAALARPLAALLSQAVNIETIAAQAASGKDPTMSALEALLTQVAPGGATAMSMLCALLMARLPRPEMLIGIADDLAARQSDKAGRAAADLAVEFILDKIESATAPDPQLDRATADVARIAAVLNDLELRSSQRPSRKARIVTLRKQLDTECRERFATELDAQLLGPASALAGAGDDVIMALEDTARDLRRFETTARQIGGADAYDKQLRRAADALRPVPGETREALVDRIRLVEILQGAHVATAMMMDTMPA